MQCEPVSSQPAGSAQTAGPASCWTTIRVAARAVGRWGEGGREEMVEDAVGARRVCFLRRTVSLAEVSPGSLELGARNWMVLLKGDEEEVLTKWRGDGGVLRTDAGNVAAVGDYKMRLPVEIFH